MSKNLSGGKVNIALLQDHLRKELLQIIDQCDGYKAIIWDEALSSPVGLIAKYSLLKEHDVVKMCKLDARNQRDKWLSTINVKNIIFITRPLNHLINHIAESIKREVGERDRKEYHLVYVPRISQCCNKILQTNGVFGSFNSISELPCHIYPFDNDLMSMELESLFKDFYVNKDPTGLYQVAEAIILLERLYGRPTRVVGKGDAAKHAWDVASRLRPAWDASAGPRPASNGLVDTMVILDRTADLVSLLATQLTYEGLIDEIFGIKYMTVILPAEKFSSSEEESVENVGDKKIVLNSDDSLYAEIRDKNFNGVGGTLNRRAKEISSQYEERSGLGQSVTTMKQFVAKLPHIIASRNSLSIHTTIAELIREVTDSNEFLDSLQLEQELMLGVDTDKVQLQIENLIAHQHDVIKVLRLICLQSATNSGLKPKVLEHYIREIIQTYGFKHILTLRKLEKAGLLRLQTNSRSYTVLRKTLKLTVEDDSEVTPSDINFVHSVYAPLSIRLVQAAGKLGGWKALTDVLDLLPGPSFEHVTPSTNLSTGINLRRDSIGSQSSQNDRMKTVMVFFVGGCTHAEIAALRFLTQKYDLNTEYVIATSKLINGNSFITSLMETLDDSFI